MCCEKKFYTSCFDSLESSSGERLILVFSKVTFPTERIMKRSNSTNAEIAAGAESGKTEFLLKLPWSFWCRTQPLNFLAGRSVCSYSEMEYRTVLFMDRYFSKVNGGLPLMIRHLFKRVRITFFGTPLAYTRVHATNSSDEKNSGRLNKKRISWDVNSFQSHLRNRYLKSVVRFPDEITYHITCPFLMGMVVDTRLNSRKPFGCSFRKLDRAVIGELGILLSMNSFLRVSFSCYTRINPLYPNGFVREGDRGVNINPFNHSNYGQTA